MARKEVADVLDRFDAAWEIKDQWESVLDDCYRFAIPMRNLYGTQTQGDLKMDRVFDSTAIKSTQRFANRIQSDLTPPFQNWLTFQAGTDVPDEEVKAVNEKLQDVGDSFFAALNNSAFATAVNEFNLDLATGMGVMLVQDGDDVKPLKITAIPQAQVATDDGPHGAVDGIFRRHKVKGRNVERTWPGAVLPADMKKSIEDDPDQEIDVREATYFDDAEGRWYYDVIVTAESSGSNSTAGEEARIWKETYDENPWIVTRWIKVAGESQGRGPLLYLLPDIRTLNKVKELILKNASIAVSGVWMGVDDGVLNVDTVEFVPGAVIPVASAGGARGPSLAALETGTKFDVAQMIIEDLQESIKAGLHDKSLPPETGQPRSATEIVERIKELQEDVGSPFGRLHTEFILPFAKRVISILQKRGEMPEGIKLDGRQVQTAVTSPLAKVQSLNDVQNVTTWLQILAGLPDGVLQLGVKIEDLPEWMAEKLGVDQDLVRSEADRKKLQQMVGAQAGAANQPGAAPGAVPTGGAPGGGAVPSVEAPGGITPQPELTAL